MSDKKSYINKRVVKKDAMALMAGRPVYTNDLAPKESLIVKALRSPHAFAKIVSIDTSKAELVPGIECIQIPWQQFQKHIKKGNLLPK